MDGVNTGTVSDTSMPTGTFNAFVGTESAAHYFFKGDIAELQVYGRALSDEECANIRTELKTKWGLP